MLAKITKSYQFDDGEEIEKFVSGSFEAIMKHAHSLVDPDSEDVHTIEFNDIKDENKITLVHWVNEYDQEYEETGEPDHYWKYAVTVQFVADVVEECKDEVVAI